MSDMEDFIDVKVTRRGREVAEGCFKLPVTIGRGEHNSVRIGHSPQDMTISRTHAIIQRTAGRLQLVDKSANLTAIWAKGSSRETPSIWCWLTVLRYLISN